MNKPLCPCCGSAGEAVTYTKVTANSDDNGTTITADFTGVILTKTSNFRWLRRGWFDKVLQQASVTQYGDVWWNDIPTVRE